MTSAASPRSRTELRGTALTDSISTTIQEAEGHCSTPRRGVAATRGIKHGQGIDFNRARDATPLPKRVHTQAVALAHASSAEGGRS